MKDLSARCRVTVCLCGLAAVLLQASVQAQVDPDDVTLWIDDDDLEPGIVMVDLNVDPPGHVVVRDLSDGRAVLWEGMSEEDSTEIRLKTPLKGGHFLEVEHESGVKTTHLVPFLVGDGGLPDLQYEPSDLEWTDWGRWDVNGDGLLDFVLRGATPFRIYCGLQTDAGYGRAHAIVPPTNGTEYLDLSRPDGIALPFSSGRREKAFTFVRAGAPGSGLATRVGDIDGDALPDDLVVTDDGARTMVHWRLGREPGAWRSMSLEAEGIDIFSYYDVQDHDGDGDLDLLFEALAGEVASEVLVLWTGSAFEVWRGPMLGISEVGHAMVGVVRIEFTMSTPARFQRIPGRPVRGDFPPDELESVLLVTDAGLSPGVRLGGVRVPIKPSALTAHVLADEERRSAELRIASPDPVSPSLRFETAWLKEIRGNSAPSTEDLLSLVFDPVAETAPERIVARRRAPKSLHAVHLLIDRRRRLVLSCSNPVEVRMPKKL